MNLKVLSCGYTGIDTYLVDVELDIGSGIPSFFIIGLGDTVVSESKERVRSAIKSFNITLSTKKIMVNLSPAYIRKEGSHFDLPMAIGILIGMEVLNISEDILKNYLFIGELSLDGNIKKVKGSIGCALLAKEKGLKGIVVPFDNLDEVLLIPDIEIIGVKNLIEIKKLFNNSNSFQVFYQENRKNFLTNNLQLIPDLEKELPYEKIDYSEVKGQKLAKRALEIAASGGHNLLMVGSPGSGKSMLAKRIVTILPEMEKDEIIECTKIYSIFGELSKENSIIIKRPFRSPHHTGTISSIIGGGRNIKPGEITLAHNGVLFLDEFSEFSKEVLESLRQPLEDGKVYISRLNYRIELPSKFMLLAASNPCNCGRYFETNQCTCSSSELNRYSKKLSGPILDRMDIFVEIKKLNETELLSTTMEETSYSIKERVLKARDIQKNRFKNTRTKLNGNMNTKEIEKFCQLDKENNEFIKTIITNFSLSARGFHKLLKLSRTIADLDNSENIEKKHILESLNFRNKIL